MVEDHSLGLALLAGTPRQRFALKYRLSTIQAHSEHLNHPAMQVPQVACVPKERRLKASGRRPHMRREGSRAWRLAASGGLAGCEIC